MKVKDFYQKYRYKNDIVVPALFKAGFEERALKISECGNWKDYLICHDCLTPHFNGAQVCKDRFCPVCSKKRSLLYFSRIVPVIRDLLHKHYYVNMLNFTIDESASLSLQETLKILTNAFRYLQHQSKTFSKIFNGTFVGGIVCKEVKRGELSDFWHPHLHCLVVKEFYSKDYDWLKIAWNESVKAVGGICDKNGTYGSIDIRSIVDKKNIYTDKYASVEVGVLETIKYVTKFEYEYDVEHLQELVKTMSHVRCINSWGLLRKIDLNVDKDLNKTYSELRHCVCVACGGTDFYEYVTTQKFSNVQDFNMDDDIIETQQNFAYKNKYIKRLVKLRDDLVVGQIYNGVLFTEKQNAFLGKMFEVDLYKGKYIVSVPGISKQSLDNNFTSNSDLIIFDQSMFSVFD